MKVKVKKAQLSTIEFFLIDLLLSDDNKAKEITKISKIYLREIEKEKIFKEELKGGKYDFNQR